MSESTVILLSFGSNQIATVDALISGHSWDAKKVSVTGAGRLREYKKTEFVGR